MSEMKKDKIIIWEGFKKEIPWILFWILLGIMVFGYYQDKKICDEVLADPCSLCYSLNETLIDIDYYYWNSKVDTVNLSIPYEDKNPNARSISSFD